MPLPKNLRYNNSTKKYEYQYTYEYPDTKEKQRFHGVCYKLDENNPELYTKTPCETLKEAKDFLKLHQIEVAKGKYRKQKPVAVFSIHDLVKTYYDEYAVTVHLSSDATRRILNRFADIICEINKDKDYPANRVVGLDIIKFRNIRLNTNIVKKTKSGDVDTGEKPKKSTINREITCIRGMYTWAMTYLTDKGFKIDKHPCAKLEPLKEDNVEPLIIHETQKQNIFEISINSQYHIHLFPFILLFCSTGVRKGEARTLRWSNVHLDNSQFPCGYLELLRTKNGKIRILPLSPDLHYLFSCMKPYATSEYVFTNPDTNTLYSNISKGIRGLLRLAKIYIKGKGSHIFRHYFATHCDELGITLPVIQVLMGHYDISQTKAYIKVNKDRTFEAVCVNSGCDISPYKKVVKLEQKKPQEIKRYIDQYMEWIKNAHKMPIKKIEKITNNNMPFKTAV